MKEMKTKRQHYWWRTVASFLMVLCLMPLGHALMILMGATMSADAVHVGAFLMGLAGYAIVVAGVFVRGDTRQTLCGLFGGLLFWTGWVEFLFQYYALRYGVSPEVENGVVVTRPEYLIMPATFGLWMMVMTLYLFCTRTGCRFFTWLQKHLFGRRRDVIVVRPLTRHVSIVTFMELNMILWTCYLALMFCYDKRFLGDHHPVTFAFGLFCFLGSVWMFIKQLHIPSWGANIRMSIATVIVFWTPVEILGRVNIFKEFWLHPVDYAPEMLAILLLFLSLLAYPFVKSRFRNHRVEQ